MTPTIRLAALATLAAAALAGSAARAQPDDHRGPAADLRARMEALRETHEKQHAQDLRIILRLRPDQEGALAAYLQSHEGREARAPGERHGPPGEPGMPPPMTTPQRLDAMERREAEHAAGRQKHAEALRAFYAALSPEQRQVFDALQRLHGGERGPWGPRGLGGPMGGPMRGPGAPPRED